jgi:hypothetical protein
MGHLQKLVYFITLFSVSTITIPVKNGVEQLQEESHLFEHIRAETCGFRLGSKHFA